MLNKIVAAGLLLSGFGFSASMWSAPATAQSALAQQAGTQQSSKTQSSNNTSSPAKSSKASTSKSAPAAKKAPPKPLVYVQDDRNVKSADAKSTDSAGTQASAGKPGDGSVKKASDTSVSKSAATAATQPLSADVTKAFLQNCPSVALTPSKSRAAYDVTFEREQTGKVKSAFGLHKTSRIEVMNKGGKELFSETGHSMGQLVKDACTSMGTPVTTKIAKN